ncbi:hypothetical protein [Parvicella tangerina]|uniref:Lipoprotein n=1 Tax=Parvicella tangerina TaxID=2829795 RepID=A0A916JLR9_9FLAO|nr:hypothetical protein [Parvicella tangerina]CAG5078217.1 hypothetical protein CRYO30217_00609 [Parvicella tangerina]
MKIVFSITTLLLIFLVSCTGTQNTTSSGENNSTETEKEISKEEEREKMILSAGYKKCEVVDMGTEDECGFVLQDLSEKKLYKPVQWQSEFVPYREDGNIVYVKFRGSKVTQTVCLQSMPVILDEMKLIE